MNGAVIQKPFTLNLRSTLNDGTRILVRTLRANDKNELLKGFGQLSSTSRRFRFLSPIRKLSEQQLSLLTNVDQVHHVAIAARDLGNPGRPGIGVARFLRFEQDPSVAEFAITVIDGYQHRGLGTLLLNLLLKAAQSLSVRILRGYLLEDNVAMIRLLDKFNAPRKRAWGNTLSADIPVPGPSS